MEIKSSKKWESDPQERSIYWYWYQVLSSVNEGMLTQPTKIIYSPWNHCNHFLFQVMFIFLKIQHYQSNSCNHSEKKDILLLFEYLKSDLLHRIQESMLGQFFTARRHSFQSTREFSTITWWDRGPLCFTQSCPTSTLPCPSGVPGYHGIYWSFPWMEGNSLEFNKFTESDKSLKHEQGWV